MAALNISIVKEQENYPGIPERRVGITPKSVRRLVASGANVYLQPGAGERAGYPDHLYENAGARLAWNENEAYFRADLLLKVSPLRQWEADLLNEEASVWSFSHMALAPDQLLQTITEKKLSVLGYETVTDDKGRLPILRIMSEIAGRLSPWFASTMLQSDSGQHILLGGIPGLPPADVVIIGAGVLGSYAADSFAGMGATVHVLDIDRDKLEEIDRFSRYPVHTALATEENIAKYAAFTNVLLTSVLLPGDIPPVIISSDLENEMKPGSAILDFSIDQGGAVASARDIGPKADFWEKDGKLFLSLPNASSQVARTASIGLSQIILPYVLDFITLGQQGLLRKQKAIREGMYFYKGVNVSDHIGNRMPRKNLDELI